MTQPPDFSFAVVTDTHLSAPSAAGDAEENQRLNQHYAQIVARISAMDPAFVVHLGDMGDPVPTSDNHRAAAQVFRDLSAPLGMPLHLVPGNHDIGEKIHKALPRMNTEVSITPQTMAQYEREYGDQWYHFEQGGCLFIVLNTMLLNAGIEQEKAQWDWLKHTLEARRGKRVFVFTHYPIYLTHRDEPDFYDNIEEPARAQLIDLLLSHRVEGYFAGHVHTFFYNQLDGMHQTIVPSAGIMRTDYTELFKACPDRDDGSFDPAKLGFVWVDVYADTHVPRFIRLNDALPYRAPARAQAGASVTLDLRLPWCAQTDIPCAWGLEIFERKEIRNDYPLAALWEMGVTDFRVPVSDLLAPKVAARIKELTALGHRFTVVSFGLPNAERRAAIAQHAKGIRAVEIAAFLDQWGDLAPDLAALRRAGGFEVFLNAVRPEVEGWTTHHGLIPERPEEINHALGQTTLRGAVDGFVFGVPQGVTPLDGLARARACLHGSGFKPLMHVPSVGMYWSTKYNDTLTENEEISRTAEAAFVARCVPEISVVIDNFVEIERGYCVCQGLVDRFYNPKAGSRVVTGLNALLPDSLSTVASVEQGGTRLLLAQSGSDHAVLICDRVPDAPLEGGDARLQGLLDLPGLCTFLDSGRQLETTLRTILDKAADSEKPVPPRLFMQRNEGA